MLVIIPHPEDELKFLNIQNFLIKKLYDINKDNIFFKTYPLWIPLSFLSYNENKYDFQNVKKQLKETAKNIQKIKLGRFLYENNNIVMEVTIFTEKEDNNESSSNFNIFTERFTEKMTLLTGCKKNHFMDDSEASHENDIELINNILNETDNIENSDINSPDEHNTIERILKIFRIGIVHNMSENSQSISDSVWCKLK